MSKIAHIKEAVESAQGDPRCLFNMTLTLMGKTSHNPMPEVSNNESIAENFANFFIGKVQTIRDSLKDTPRYIPKGRDVSDLINLSPIEESQVCKLVTQAKPTTCDLDPLPSSLVKDNKDILLPIISKIINDSLTQGKFYDSWKMATVRPLLKSPSLDHIYKNYRPVSNLSFISKLTEKAFIHQLKEHLDNNNLHSTHQSAYKQNFSTETAVCHLVDRLLWNMERGAITVMVAVDLSSAFDTVDHTILSNVLQDDFGVKGNALNWAKSYLIDRQLQVKVGEDVSSVHTFNYSVPQGSCLGPIFFNIYSSTIIDCITSTQCIGGYADDDFIYDSFSTKSSGDEAKCIKNLENTLINIENWMSANTLKMNTSKTEFTLIGSRHFLNKIATSSITVGNRSSQSQLHVKTSRSLA